MLTPNVTMSTGDAAIRICAVVVAYYPDSAFTDRLKAILPQVQSLLIVDNTPEGASLSQCLNPVTNDASVSIIRNRANKGIAAALNQGIEHARAIGCNWLLTLDQDTECYPDMVTTLTNVHDSCDPKPVIIGSNYFDPQNGRPHARPSAVSAYSDVKTVITSGCLLNVALADAIGGFREDYFIDQVDHEFCLRARANGGRIVVSSKPAMAHSVGRAGGVKLPFLGILPSHPPVRKFYIARNTVITVLLYWRQEPAWCLRRMTRLILGLLLLGTLENNRILKIRAFAAGSVDGVRGRMGPCTCKWLS